jgi:nucleoside-diphosphate-sugar epimerase
MRNSRQPLVGQTILVTGGAGFLGVHLAHALAQRGARLVLQDTHSKRQASLEPLLAGRRVQLALGDLPSLAAGAGWRKLLRQVDYVVHLALTVPVVSDRARTVAEYQSANLGPFQQLLAMLPARTRGVCLASSLSVYGSVSPEPLTEDQPPLGASAYALTKLAMEAALADFGQQSGRPVTVLRYSTLYGPSEYHSPRAIPSFIRNLLAGQPPVIYGDGADINDYLHVRDAAQGTCLALERLETAAGVYNIASGHGWTTRAIAEHVQRMMGVSLPPKHMPARGPRQCVVADISRARARLGYEPQISLEAGLCAEIEDQREYSAASAEASWYSSPATGAVRPQAANQLAPSK